LSAYGGGEGQGGGVKPYSGEAPLTRPLPFKGERVYAAPYQQYLVLYQSVAYHIYT